jgi:lipopolysaccharide transport system permease protein
MNSVPQRPSEGALGAVGSSALPAEGGPEAATAMELSNRIRDLDEPELDVTSLRTTTSLTRSTVHEELADAWRHRGLLPLLGSRIVMKTYAKTILGRWWLLILPLMDTLGKTLIFGGLLKISTPHAIPYLLFLLVGMQGWRLFQRTLYLGTRSFDRYAKLTRSFHFPILLVPLASTSAGLVEFAVYLVIIAATLGYYWAADGVFYLQVQPELLIGLSGFALCILFAWGLSLWTAVLNSRARDTRLALRYVFQLWLYITPVIYPLSTVPGGLRALAQVNPMAPIIEMTKYGLIGAGHLTMAGAAWACTATAISLGTGLWFFNRFAPSVVHRGADDDDDDDLEDY